MKQKICIDYNYISKEKINENTFSQVLDLMSQSIYDIAIIDNIDKGIRMYPNEIIPYSYECKPNNLIKKVKELVDKKTEAVIINDFDCSLDMIRDELISLVEEGTAIIINNTCASDTDNRIGVIISEDITNHSDKEWEEIKENIKRDIDLAIKKKEEEDYLNLDSNTNKKDLYNFFNLGSLLDDEEDCIEDYDRFEYEEIKESYSYSINSNTIKISTTTENSILINDGDETIKILPCHHTFLLETLTKILNK